MSEKSGLVMGRDKKGRKRMLRVAGGAAAVGGAVAAGMALRKRGSAVGSRIATVTRGAGALGKGITKQLPAGGVQRVTLPGNPATGSPPRVLPAPEAARIKAAVVRMGRTGRHPNLIVDPVRQTKKTMKAIAAYKKKGGKMGTKLNLGNPIKKGSFTVKKRSFAAEDDRVLRLLNVSAELREF